MVAEHHDNKIYIIDRALVSSLNIMNVMYIEKRHNFMLCHITYFSKLMNCWILKKLKGFCIQFSSEHIVKNYMMCRIH